MKNYLALLLLSWGAMAFAQGAWKPLFTEQIFTDFQKLNGTAEYSYEDGILTGTTKHNSPNTFLATKALYHDFILEFEVNIEYGMNSGVQFRSAKYAGEGPVYGYQAEIETSNRKWAGGIYDESRRGWLYPLSRNEKGQNAFKNGTWNHYRIEAIGNTIRTWVNGVPCANLVDDLTSEGFIAFQVHAIGPKQQAGQKVQWRKARILTKNMEKARWPIADTYEISYLTNRLTEQERRKGWRLLWDGKTTNGWRGINNTEEISTDDWSVDEGVLSSNENGVDFISEQQFLNFELSIDFKIAPGASSGITYLYDQGEKEENTSAFGLEFQIIDDATHPDAKAGVKGNHTSGALYDLIPPENLTEANNNNKRYKQGQFNRARIVVKDNLVEHWLNDIKIVEYDRQSQLFRALVSHSQFQEAIAFGTAQRGQIVLQNQDGLVAFKNIKIREF